MTVVRLFCFHHAGGGSSLYRGWQRALGPQVTVRPVVLPGRDERTGQPRFTDLGALVAELDGELDGELAEAHVFFGHSMGSLVAYRLACHRRARGADLPRALFLSAYPAPHLPTPLPSGDNPDLAGLLAGIGGVPAELLDWPSGLAELLAVARDDLKLCASASGDQAPLPLPVHLFGGEADPLLTSDDLSAWQEHTTLPVELTILTGDHFYLRDDPGQLLQHLRPLLRRYS